MKKSDLAFIDLETTGLDPDKHEIIEIGCIVARPPEKGARPEGSELKIISELELKVKPEHLETAEPEALRINGYSDAEWLFAVSLEQALTALAEKTDGAMMISHNITFDWPFLQRGFAATKVRNRLHGVRLDLLSMAFAKLHSRDEVQRFNLRALGEHFGIKNERAHSALADTRAALEIYKKLLTV